MVNEIIQGPALENLQKLDTDSIDLIVTDPPYGYSFMNKDWDKAVVSTDTWRQCLRVLKPGAFAFIMSSPRQDVFCKMMLNLIEAGFRTDFSSLYHTYASGFPKAADIPKLIEKRNGNGKELEGSYAGFQPKPAVELILVVMKPLSEKSYVDQALANKKGITWLDSVRIPYQNEQDKTNSVVGFIGHEKFSGNTYDGIYRINRTVSEKQEISDKGRFPANLLVEDDVLNDGKITKSSGGTFRNQFHSGDNIYNKNYAPKNIRSGDSGYGDIGSFSRYFSLDAWAKTLPFLLVPKPAKSEKGEFNKHPTVKSLKLMSYLIMMGSRETDTVLDPFCGSGTVLIAAHELHRQYIGIEISQEYCEIARERLRPHKEQKRIQEFTNA